MCCYWERNHCSSLCSCESIFQIVFSDSSDLTTAALCLPRCSSSPGGAPVSHFHTCTLIQITKPGRIVVLQSHDTDVMWNAECRGIVRNNWPENKLSRTRAAENAPFSLLLLLLRWKLRHRGTCWVVCVRAHEVASWEVRRDTSDSLIQLITSSLTEGNNGETTAIIKRECTLVLQLSQEEISITVFSTKTL